jgi:trans-aconitate methyltransferase
LTDQDALRIDTSIAHPARRYNYWLGGKDHFQADRESGDAIALALPTIRAAALANRAFMGRAIRVVVEAGVRQFLDVGTGIPAPGNTHEVAQAIAPESRVVYVDNDPIVMSHARALLTSTGPGRTAYLEADLRDVDDIIHHPQLRSTLDLSQPVGLLLVAILHFLQDHDDAYAVVADLVGRLAPGSYLVLSHGTADFAPAAASAPATQAGIVGQTRQHGSIRTRSLVEVARFLDGLEVLAPGIVSVSDWRAEDEPADRLSPAETSIYGAVARIP